MMPNTALLLSGLLAKEAALLAALAGRIYDHAPQQNAFPLDGSKCLGPDKYSHSCCSALAPHP